LGWADLIQKWLLIRSPRQVRLDREEFRRFLRSSRAKLPLVLLAEFFHDEFVEWTLRTDSPPLQAALRGKSLWTWVEKEGVPVASVGGIDRVPLEFDDKKNRWRGTWPVPWNAPDGVYRIRLDTATVSAALPPVVTKPFSVVSRPFQEIPPGFGAITLEALGTMNNAPAPDGTRKDFTAMLDWADFIGADAVWVQGAESGGYEPKARETFPWHARSLSSLREWGRECDRRGLQFGVYVLCFLVGGSPEFSPDYRYGWTVQNGELVNGLDLKRRRGVSITDEKRVKDIAALLQRWRDLPEVDLVGLDYIRPVFGGFELVDDFVREMPVDIPNTWSALSFKDRMRWLLQNRVHGTHAFRDKWYWYRAHRTARVVREIKSALGDSKPLWAFTLSWEKGWHHGQDPVMMRDAGLDQDAIMLYEATSEQFGAIIRQWRSYVTRAQVNLTVGNTFDWVLHQRTLRPAGPEDFYNRSVNAVVGFHVDGPVRGLFLHDFLRAWRGRLGPYSSREWMLAGGASLTTLRRHNRRLTYDLALRIPSRAKPSATQTGTLHFQPEPPRPEPGAAAPPGLRPARAAVGPVSAKLYAAPDVEIWPDEFELSASSPTATFQFRWIPTPQSAERADRSFVAVRAQRLDASRERCQIHIMYFQGDRPSPPRPAARSVVEELPPSLQEHTHEADPIEGVPASTEGNND
jgi:hypothetical protein